MLGKLIKHEFRATARRMLILLGALALLGLLANLSLRLLPTSDSIPLNILLVLFIASFFVGLIAANVITVVFLVVRFHSNLLRDEGYLMFTLPTDVHKLVWSKLICAVVWELLMVLLSGILGWTVMIKFLGMEQSFPSFSQIMQELQRSTHMTAGQLWLFAGEMALVLLVSCTASLLQFYAAMGIGQMVNRRRGLLGVGAYLGLNSIYQTVTFVLMIFGLGNNGNLFLSRYPLDYMALSYGVMGLVMLVHGVGLYIITTVTLKRKLNLA